MQLIITMLTTSKIYIVTTLQSMDILWWILSAIVHVHVCIIRLLAIQQVQLKCIEQELEA